MTSATPSSGILVLGMHRSGTSALTRVLDLCGADVGSRILGESAGNESGHWEDAVAVELHERLLAALGTRWDEVFGLPADWRHAEAAVAAQETIRAYLEGNRSVHALWAVKDPRLSLFVDLWQGAAKDAGLALGAVVMLRHPLEVANSLMARDGIALERGLLLWLDYTLAAIQAAKALPCVLVTYDQLLKDWRSCISQIGSLPGGQYLHADPATVRAVDEFLDESRRHHKELRSAEMPKVISDVWMALSGAALEGLVSDDFGDLLAASVTPVRELVRPLLGEQRLLERKLWQRIYTSEIDLPAALSRTESRVEIGTRSIEHQKAELRALQQVMAQQHSDVINAISEDIRRMQGVVNTSIERAASSEGKVAIAEQLASRFDQLCANQAARHAEALSEIRGAGGMAAHLVHATQLVAAAETRTNETRTLLERELDRVAGMPGMQERLEASIVERTQLQLDIGKLEIELAESRNAWRGLEARVEIGVRDREEAERQLEGQRHQLAVLRHEVERLLGVEDQHKRVIRSLSWRSTRPLRLTKRLLSGRWSSSDNDRLRNLWREVLLRLPLADHLRSRLIGRTLVNESDTIATLPDHRVATVVGLAAPIEGLPDVFVWSVIDFHFRVQRPQHLARALAAKGHRVFYISVNFCDSDAAGFHFDPIDGCGRLYQIHLYLAGEPLIYTHMPSAEQVEALHASLATLLAWSRTASSISLVQHPYWSALVRSVPNARVVYDCMDHHAGFDNNSSMVLEAERGLVKESDLVIVTSSWLEGEVGGAAQATAVIRNAGEFAFFNESPAEVFRDEHGRRVIGYYGAIASWFDFDLVRRVAQAHSEALVVLIGHDSTGEAASLADLGNVLLVGEVPYTHLPYWLHAFDVCLLPFKVIPLTLATNPVKVYEYLAAGKSVVAVDLPEMVQFDGLIQTAADSDSFLAAVSDALAAPASAEMVAKRRTFASLQTWQHRAAELDTVLENLEEPLISVVVLTYNNLAFTQACLHSIEVHSDYRNLEVIVVDNASSDGSVEYLRRWAEESSGAGHVRRLIENQDNLGFAAGNNVGLAAACGDTLVMLNNDTFVTPGWVRTLHAHLVRDKGLGLVGPVTNNIGNEARIDTCYADMDQMVAQAGNYTRAHPGKAMPIDTVAFFCVMLTRAVYDLVGGLDEAFGLGFFEDDDYCRRVEQAGWKVACAEDVFIHHHLSASFDQVGVERKQALFEQNKAIYEAKWGEWKPHVYRPASDTGPKS